MNRRSFLSGLIAAPAIVAVGNIMPVRSIERFATGGFIRGPGLVPPPFCFEITLEEWTVDNIKMALLGIEPSNLTTHAVALRRHQSCVS